MEIRSKKALSGGTWIIGKEDHDGAEFKFEALVFETPSQYGIENGKISKLFITLAGETLVWYDRGWEQHPTEEVLPIYEGLLEAYNS